MDSRGADTIRGRGLGIGGKGWGWMTAVGEGGGEGECLPPMKYKGGIDHDMVWEGADRRRGGG